MGRQFKSRFPEMVSGAYTAVPHKVLDSRAFMGANHTARSLLFEIIRQHNGRNNGHFHLAQSWLKKRGFASMSVVSTARDELIERGLIVLTRRGGRNAGPNYYAVTWLSISDYSGLDIKLNSHVPGAYRDMDSKPLTKKRMHRSVGRSNAVPCDGAEAPHADPSHGTVLADFKTVAVPSDGNDVLHHVLPFKPSAMKRRPIVGGKGRSGIPRSARFYCKQSPE